MNIKEAYEKVREKQSPSSRVCIQCLDLGNRWAFMFHSELISPIGLVGGGYDAINKKTGEITFISSSPRDMVKLMFGREVNIKQFTKDDNTDSSKLNNFLSKFFNRT